MVVSRGPSRHQLRHVSADGGRRPRALARIPPTRSRVLVISVAIAHGAGLMLVPIFLGLCQAFELDAGHRAAGALMKANLGMVLLVSVVHVTALVCAGGCAWLVYRYLGLKFVTRTGSSGCSLGDQPHSGRRGGGRLQSCELALRSIRASAHSPMMRNRAFASSCLDRVMRSIGSVIELPALRPLAQHLQNRLHAAPHSSRPIGVMWKRNSSIT